MIAGGYHPIGRLDGLVQHNYAGTVHDPIVSRDAEFARTAQDKVEFHPGRSGVFFIITPYPWGIDGSGWP
jgi:hypothetical protein